jgi:hypothetical protein
VWYFFPVVYFFKTPIAFLISNVLSTARTWMSVQRFGLSVERLFPVLGVLAVFVCNMFSNINVGLRHALPVYPLFAVSAGYGLLWLWQRRKNMAVALAMRSALCAVLAWQVYDFTAAYPERTAYYNIMATALTDGNPERISPDSDVESGQGFFQLAEVIKRRGIKKMMGCFWLGGSIRRLNEDLPIRLDKCALKTPVHGWLVVSRMHKLVRVERTTWLNQYQPIENIGKTLLLYYIE